MVYFLFHTRPRITCTGLQFLQVGNSEICLEHLERIASLEGCALKHLDKIKAFAKINVMTEDQGIMGKLQIGNATKI